MSQQPNQSTVVDSPFYLNENAAYQQWREAKLRYRKPAPGELFVQIRDPYQLSDDEKTVIADSCQHFNMAIYQLSSIDAEARNQDKSLVHALGAQLAMETLMPTCVLTRIVSAAWKCVLRQATSIFPTQIKH